MRHEADHVAHLVPQARDVVHRSVRVGLRRGAAVLVDVAEDHEAALLDPGDGRRVGHPAALAVRDGHSHQVPPQAARERGRVALDPHADPVAAELEAGVARQRARQQSRLAQDLEAVAAAEHGAARLGEAAQLADRRREARDRAGADVVAVGEAAGDDRGVEALEPDVLVPQDPRLRAYQPERVLEVALAPRSREAEDRDLHHLSMLGDRLDNYEGRSVTLAHQISRFLVLRIFRRSPSQPVPLSARISLAS